MNQDVFRILVVDLARGKGRVEIIAGRSTALGGSGLAALLFEKYGDTARPWDEPEQPFILAVGPLTGLFPLMSKTRSAPLNLPIIINTLKAMPVDAVLWH